jgi:hypothetical protein
MWNCGSKKGTTWAKGIFESKEKESDKGKKDERNKRYR